MTYQQAVDAVEADLRGKPRALVERVLRDIDAMRGTPAWVDGAHPAVSHAAGRVLTDHYAADIADAGVDGWIAAYRALPNTQTDPVQRCHTDALTRHLEAALPDVADEAIDRFIDLELPEDTWPAYLADAYAAAYRPGPHDVRTVDTGAGWRVSCLTCVATLGTYRVEGDAWEAESAHRGAAVPAVAVPTDGA